MSEPQWAAAPIVGLDRQPTAGIGAPLPRLDGHEKVTGEARYAGEEVPANTLHAVMVTSTIANGHVTGIDTVGARTVPGMVTVLTYEDMPELRPVPGLIVQSILPMQSSEIHYEGEPLALVLAETLEAAEEAAARVVIAYERREPVMFETGQESIPRSFSEGNGWGFMESDTQTGDADNALANAAVSIDQTYLNPYRHHNAMEPPTTLARWQGGLLDVYDATQNTYGVRYELSLMLGIPLENIRVHCPYTGGGFGMKAHVWPHQLLTVLAAKITGRPVKLNIERVGCFTDTGYQPIMRSRVRLGASREGVLSAIIHETANVTSLIDDYNEYGAAGTRSLYAAPAIVTGTRVIHANVGMPSNVRAPNEGTGMFALESAMDELAYELGIDPLELRLRNYTEVDPQSGKPFSSKKLREAYIEAARRFGWSNRSPAPRSMRDGNKLIGWGMASAIMATVRGGANARIRFAMDGTVTVETATQEIGTGPTTILPQIAADVLNIPIERITLGRGDTDLPEAPGTYGSMTTLTVGSAVTDAAEKLKTRVAGLAGSKDAPPPEKWAALLSERGIAEVIADGGFQLPGGAPFDIGGGQLPYSMHSWGTVFVEMEVDEALGRARMRRCVAGYSAGRIINPRTARSQIIGGIIWGYGRAMLEESVMDRRYGRYLSKNLSGVMVPVNADIPRDIDVFFVDEYDANASKIGARGIGEVAEVGVAAAITNALYHATGKRIRKLPVHIADLLA